MNGRSAASLLAIVTLVAAGLAGCVEAPSFLTNADSEASAKENRDLADSAAAAWNPEASLVAVMTFEASEADAEEGAGAIPVDPSVGNGRALLWFYGYQTPGGNETRLFRVTADGGVQVENTSAMPLGPGDLMKPVEKWNVDSDAAVDAARADERFEEVVAAENASMMMALGSEEGISKWILLAHAGGKMVVAAVDAETGTLLMVEQVDFDDMVMPDVPTPPGYVGPTIHLEGSGRLDAATRVFEAPFAYSGYGDMGVLEIHTSKMMPAEGVWYAIVDAEGDAVVEGSMTRLVTPTHEAAIEFELDEPGQYTFILGYETLVGMTPVPVPLSGIQYEFMLHVGEMTDMEYEEESEDD